MAGIDQISKDVEELKKLLEGDMIDMGEDRSLKQQVINNTKFRKDWYRFKWMWIAGLLSTFFGALYLLIKIILEAKV